MEFEVMFGYRLKMLVDDPEEIENMMTKVYIEIENTNNVLYHKHICLGLQTDSAYCQH